jgi:hypothetical protein
MSQPHLVLFWTFDIPNQKLFIKIADDLEYVALEGGTLGYTKTYKGEVTHIEPLDWELSEKDWISQNYGETYGYFQSDDTRTKRHPDRDWDELCRYGLGPDGNYIDHLQRMQIIMEGHDMATIFKPDLIEAGSALFATPDNGLTIYKRVATRDVLYASKNDNESFYWIDMGQPCGMQPRAKGYQLSNHDELLAAGCSQEDVDQCKRGEWASPKHPELQQYYVYPTA